MTKKQLEFLNLLGYVKSNEEGALLFNPMLRFGDFAYIWKDSDFNIEVSLFSARLEGCLRFKISYEVRGME